MPCNDGLGCALLKGDVTRKYELLRSESIPTWQHVAVSSARERGDVSLDGSNVDCGA